VAIGADKIPVGLVRVPASVGQAERLLTWTESWPEQTWAESAASLGQPLAQELMAAWPDAAVGHGAVNDIDPDDACWVASRRCARLPAHQTR
jgi:hypothetical protein